MAQLSSGQYTPKTAKTVTVWPKPDVNGDGEPVYIDMVDSEGRLLGREILTTESGQEVRHYSPPTGFSNFPSREAGADGSTDNYIRVDGRGMPVRDVHGHAVGIREGTALVENPDGSSEVLTGDYAQVLFGRAHEQVGSQAAETQAPRAPAPPPSPQAAPPPWGG